jgi:hypothetical protein
MKWSQFNLLWYNRFEVTVRLMAEDLHRPADEVWLDSDLGGPLPPFDWGPDGRPPIRPVRFDPDNGLAVEGDK